MSACSKKMILYMHDYLDGEISKEHEEELKEHLQSCKSCQQTFQELRRTDAFLRGEEITPAPENFTAAVMAKLPAEPKKTKIQNWLRSHPFFAAASLFIILMAGSIFSMWNDQRDFSFTKDPHLEVKNHTVIVPKGEVVKKDLVIRNGNIKIDGKVEGDVAVINGKKYMASSSSVSGDIEEINQIYDWIWFKMKEYSKEFGHLFRR